MNIVVGYIQSLGDHDVTAHRSRLLAIGCDTVRVETSTAADVAAKPVLNLVCEFLHDGDELVVPDLTHLGRSPGPIATLVSRLEARGACVRFLDPAVSTRELAGRALISALKQLSGAGEPREAPQRRRAVDAQTVRALSANGLGPSQIARELGVSRMTVWRKLAVEQGV